MEWHSHVAARIAELTQNGADLQATLHMLRERREIEARHIVSLELLVKSSSSAADVFDVQKSIETSRASIATLDSVIAQLNQSIAEKAGSTSKRLTYSARSQISVNACGKALFELMERKKTNLSIAADVSTKSELIALADLLGPYICVLKTHIDIVVDFDDDLAAQLKALSEKHDFMIFEDRKFADIGNTSMLQYSQGVYKIVDWAHITNAHVVPGPGIIKGLKEAGIKKDRGLLLLAEMSSAGSLATGSYTQAAINMAKENKDFVFGFISQNKLIADDETFIYMSPGVNLTEGKDNLGQQYRTPDMVVAAGSDIIIVGRGVYKAADPIAAAKAYRDAGWNAYLKYSGQL
eukprot:Colp12_sorted_trinity150504_noHs@20234